MRHRYNRLRKLNSWVQKRQQVIRNLLTSLVEHSRVITTPQKAKVLRYEMDRLLSRAVKIYSNYEDEKDKRREIIREAKKVFFTEKAGKKFVNELLPKYIEENRNSGFTRIYRVWVRRGDNVVKMLVELV